MCGRPSQPPAWINLSVCANKQNKACNESDSALMESWARASEVSVGTDVISPYFPVRVVRFEDGPGVTCAHISVDAAASEEHSMHGCVAADVQLARLENVIQSLFTRAVVSTGVMEVSSLFARLDGTGRTWCLWENRHAVRSCPRRCKSRCMAVARRGTDSRGAAAGRRACECRWRSTRLRWRG